MLISSNDCKIFRESSHRLGKIGTVAIKSAVLVEKSLS